jgi:hypothetical protein
VFEPEDVARLEIAYHTVLHQLATLKAAPRDDGGKVHHLSGCRARAAALVVTGQKNDRRRVLVGVSMEITKDQAAEMYARACKAWYGCRAKRIVHNKIRELRQKGDVDGVRAWTEVERHLGRIPAHEFERARRPATL